MFDGIPAQVMEHGTVSVHTLFCDLKEMRLNLTAVVSGPTQDFGYRDTFMLRLPHQQVGPERRKQISTTLTDVEEAIHDQSDIAAPPYATAVES